MSWFGFGGSNNSSEDTSAHEHTSSFGNDHSYDSGADYQPQSGGGGGFAQELLIEQQKQMIQAVLLNLTDKSFEVCVPKPSSSLSNSEKACVNSVVSKYLETSQFVIASLQNQK